MPGRIADRGVGWVLFQFVLLAVVFGGGMLWHDQWSSRWPCVAGVVLLVLGGICGAAGALALGRSLTPFPRPSARTRLVRGGIYGLMRHPLYTAVFCGALGWALVCASWPALAAALCLGPFLNAKASIEERALRERFPDYEAYQAQVKRFIPGIY